MHPRHQVSSMAVVPSFDFFAMSLLVPVFKLAHLLPGHDVVYDIDALSPRYFRTGTGSIYSNGHIALLLSSVNRACYIYAGTGTCIFIWIKNVFV